MRLSHRPAVPSRCAGRATGRLAADRDVGGDAGRGQQVGQAAARVARIQHLFGLRGRAVEQQQPDAASRAPGHCRGDEVANAEQAKHQAGHAVRLLGGGEDRPEQQEAILVGLHRHDPAGGDRLAGALGLLDRCVARRLGGEVEGQGGLVALHRRDIHHRHIACSLAGDGQRAMVGAFGKMNAGAELGRQLLFDGGTLVVGHHLRPFERLDRGVARADRFGESLELVALHGTAGFMERGQRNNRAERGVDAYLQRGDLPDRLVFEFRPCLRLAVARAMDRGVDRQGGTDDDDQRQRQPCHRPPGQARDRQGSTPAHRRHPCRAS
jgi:hypothetical protein